MNEQLTPYSEPNPPTLEELEAAKAAKLADLDEKFQKGLIPQQEYEQSKQVITDYFDQEIEKLKP